jgi:hypothetical protein
VRRTITLLLTAFALPLAACGTGDQIAAATEPHAQPHVTAVKLGTAPFDTHDGRDLRVAADRRRVETYLAGVHAHELELAAAQRADLARRRPARASRGTPRTVTPRTVTPRTAVRARTAPAAPAPAPGDCIGGWAGMSLDARRARAHACWDGLIAAYPWSTSTAFAVMFCESKGDPLIHNQQGSSATGLFQVLGGSTDPATNVSQAYHNKYAHGGWAHWNASRSCWA